MASLLSTQYKYLVDQDGPIKTIQQAINNVITSLSPVPTPTITQDIVIQVADGTYPGFSIPDGALLPLLGGAFRLVIQSAGTFFPVIDYNFSPTSQFIGADIGSANPMVKIEGLRFQHFPVGIRIATNSHKPIVKDCLVTNNRNVGILVDQADETQILQNVVVNGDYGIVTRLCKDIAIIHNTVFMSGNVSNTAGKAQSAVWASLANDYGGGLNDTGKLYLLGNIAYNPAGTCFTVFVDDLERPAIVSDFNLWSLGGTPYIVVTDKTYFKGAAARPRQTYPDLLTWKANSLLDNCSKSQDPKFIQTIQIKGKPNGLLLDLTLLPLSPALRMVPSFAYDAAAAAKWLPGYVDSAEFLKDILQVPRLQGGTAAGSNDKESSSGFFGQDVFASPLNLGASKNCNVNPLFELIYKNLDIWYPKIKSGYFYSHEREYYLYASKGCKYIGELAVTEFQLPARVVSTDPVSLYVAGTQVTDPSYMDIRGDVLVLYHRDLPIVNRDEEIEIDCTIREWKNHGFSKNQVFYRFKIRDGKTRYFLPEDYVPKGPVVVTDDHSSLSDPEKLAHREFSVEWNSDVERAEIVFANHHNLVRNPQFDFGFGETGNNLRVKSKVSPTEWGETGAYIYHAEHPHYTVMGENKCIIPNNTRLTQLLPTHSGNSILSWYSLNYGLAPGQITTEFFDQDHNPLGVTATGTFHGTTGEYWTRFYMGFGNPPVHDKVEAPLGEPLSGLGYHTVPDNASYLHVTFRTFRGDFGMKEESNIHLDAVQYEWSQVPSIFHRVFNLNELTVEYETSDSQEYIDTKHAIAPVRNLMNQGFLYIPELPANLYDGPLDSTITTLFEWRWPQGRMKHLPWARLSGKDKLRKRAKGRFHKIPEPPKEVIRFTHPTPKVDTITVTPSIPIVRQGDTNGVGFAIQATDNLGNPYGLGMAYAFVNNPFQRFPGWLSKKKYGLNEQLTQGAFGRLDNAGIMALTWIPPTEADALFVGQVPTTVNAAAGSPERISTIEVCYPVNIDFHGNVIVLREGEESLQTTGDPIRGTYSPAFSATESVVSVQYPIVPGSVRVHVGSTEFVETIVAPPETDQFFVDYDASTITVKGRHPQITIEYTPSYVFINATSPYQIMFYHDKVFQSYPSGPVTVGYDLQIGLDIQIVQPDMGLLKERFPLVAQNPLTSNRKLYNTAALEI